MYTKAEARSIARQQRGTAEHVGGNGYVVTTYRRFCQTTDCHSRDGSDANQLVVFVVDTGEAEYVYTTREAWEDGRAPLQRGVRWAGLTAERDNV